MLLKKEKVTIKPDDISFRQKTCHDTNSATRDKWFIDAIVRYL